MAWQKAAEREKREAIVGKWQGCVRPDDCEWVTNDSLLDNGKNKLQLKAEKWEEKKKVFPECENEENF